MPDHPPIDALEKKIRLGCGLIAGSASGNGPVVGTVRIGTIAVRSFMWLGRSAPEEERGPFQLLEDMHTIVLK